MFPYVPWTISARLRDFAAAVCLYSRLFTDMHMLTVAPFNCEMYLCSSHTTFMCDILQHVRKAPQSYTTTAHTPFVSGLDQYFPKDSSSKDLARKSPKGISVVHQCPSFHFLSCTLSVCSSWSLFSSFLKVTSTAMCLSLCVRAVISSHLQHAAADYLNVNLFTPQNMQERRERSWNNYVELCRGFLHCYLPHRHVKFFSRGKKFLI